MIITYNLSDFPTVLREYDIEPLHPNQFIVNLIDQDEEKAVIALEKLVERLKNPPLTAKEVLQSFRKCNLHDTSDRFIRVYKNS